MSGFGGYKAKVRRSTWVYVGCALVWLLTVVMSPTFAEFACFIAMLALAWYDYMLQWAKDLLEEFNR